VANHRERNHKIKKSLKTTLRSESTASVRRDVSPKKKGF